MSTGNMLTPGLFWAGYICLAGGAFALWLPVLGLLPLPVLVVALILRHMAATRQDAVSKSHAQWQLHTFWLLFFLLVVLVGLFAAMGIVYSEVAVLDLVEGIGAAYSANQIDLSVVLERFWAIGEIRYFTCAGLLWLVLALVWPLKRILQGIWAMYAGCPPSGMGHGVRWLALAGAVILQGGLMALVVVL